MLTYAIIAIVWAGVMFGLAIVFGKAIKWGQE
jgi:hypothetical protein